jgi:hypothetical protein
VTNQPTKTPVAEAEVLILLMPNPLIGHDHHATQPEIVSLFSLSTNQTENILKF